MIYQYDLYKVSRGIEQRQWILSEETFVELFSRALSRPICTLETCKFIVDKCQANLHRKNLWNLFGDNKLAIYSKTEAFHVRNEGGRRLTHSTSWRTSKLSRAILIPKRLLQFKRFGPQDPDQITYLKFILESLFPALEHRLGLPLRCALMSQDYELIKLFLDAGCDPIGLFSENMDRLLYHNASMEILKLYLERSSYSLPSVIGLWGDRLVEAAVMYGRMEFGKFFEGPP